MASLSVISSDGPSSTVDYSMTGEVTKFVLEGVVLFDKSIGKAEPRWKMQLIEFVRAERLHINRGKGLHKFVYRLQEDGLL